MENSPVVGTLTRSIEMISQIESIEARAERAEKALPALSLKASAEANGTGVPLIAFVAEDWRRAIVDEPPIYAIKGNIVRLNGPVS